LAGGIVRSVSRWLIYVGIAAAMGAPIPASGADGDIRVDVQVSPARVRPGERLRGTVRVIGAQALPVGAQVWAAVVPYGLVLFLQDTELVNVFKVFGDVAFEAYEDLKAQARRSPFYALPVRASEVHAIDFATSLPIDAPEKSGTYLLVVFVASTNEEPLAAVGRAAVEVQSDPKRITLIGAELPGPKPVRVGDVRHVQVRYRVAGLSLPGSVTVTERLLGTNGAVNLYAKPNTRNIIAATATSEQTGTADFTVRCATTGQKILRYTIEAPGFEPLTGELAFEAVGPAQKKTLTLDTAIVTPVEVELGDRVQLALRYHAEPPPDHNAEVTEQIDISGPQMLHLSKSRRVNPDDGKGGADYDARFFVPGRYTATIMLAASEYTFGPARTVSFTVASKRASSPAGTGSTPVWKQVEVLVDPGKYSGGSAGWAHVSQGRGFAKGENHDTGIAMQWAFDEPPAELRPDVDGNISLTLTARGTASGDSRLDCCNLGGKFAVPFPCTVHTQISGRVFNEPLPVGGVSGLGIVRQAAVEYRCKVSAETIYGDFEIQQIGWGAAAAFKYKKQTESTSSSTGGTAAGSVVVSDVTPESIASPEFTARLDAEALESVPGEPSKVVHVYIKGYHGADRAEVIVPTVDGFGSLEVNRNIVVFGNAAQATAPMRAVETDRGEYPWTLMFATRSTAQPATTVIPITVRAGERQVRLSLTIRILPGRAVTSPHTGASPPIAQGNAPGGLRARLDPFELSVGPGEASRAFGVVVEGGRADGGPVEVVLPKTLPGGLLTFPGTTTVDVAGTAGGVHRIVERVRARDGAPVGASTIDVLVRQGSDSVQLRLRAAVVASSAGTSSTAGSAYDHAVALIEQKRFTEAEALFLQSIRDDPRNARLRYGLGGLLATQSRWADAAIAYKDAVLLEPTNAEYQFRLANAYAFQNAWTQAETSYRAAVRLNSNHALAHNGLADALFFRGAYEDAQREYTDALRIEPSNGRFHANLAGVLLRRGRRTEALDEARTALATGFKEHWVYGELGLAR